MSKRRRTSGGSVTGGTGDIKPQILTVSTSATAGVADYAVAQVNLPVPRFGTMKTKATVFEILRIDYYPNITDAADVSSTEAAFMSTQALRTQNDTCSLVTLAEDVLDPVGFGFVMQTTSVSTNGGWTKEYPISYDFTDQNGNGIIIATDRLFFHIGSVGNTAVGTGAAKILYRLVNIGITEYVGIVQSQQG